MVAENNQLPPIFVAVELEVLAQLDAAKNIVAERPDWRNIIKAIRGDVNGLGLWSNAPFQMIQKAVGREDQQLYFFYGSGNTWFHTDNGAEVKVFETVSNHVMRKLPGKFSAPLSEENFLLVDTKENASKAGLLPNTIVLPLAQPNDPQTFSDLDKVKRYIQSVLLPNYFAGPHNVRVILERFPFDGPWNAPAPIPPPVVSQQGLTGFLRLPDPQPDLWMRNPDERKPLVVVVDTSFFMTVTSTPSVPENRLEDGYYVHTRSADFNMFFRSIVRKAHVVIRSSSYSRKAIVRALESLGSVVVGRDIAFICGCDERRTDDQAWMSNVVRQPNSVDVDGPEPSGPRGKVLPHLVNYFAGLTGYPEVFNFPTTAYFKFPISADNVVLIDPYPDQMEKVNCILCEMFSSTTGNSAGFGQVQRPSPALTLVTQRTLFVLDGFNPNVDHCKNVTSLIDRVQDTENKYPPLQYPALPPFYASERSDGIMPTTFNNSMYRLVYNRTGAPDHDLNKQLLNASTLRRATEGVLSIFGAIPQCPLENFYGANVDAHYQDVGPFCRDLLVMVPSGGPYPFKWFVNNILQRDEKTQLKTLIPLIKCLNNRIRYFSKQDEKTGQYLHPLFAQDKILYFGQYVTDAQICAAQDLLPMFNGYCRIAPVIVAGSSAEGAKDQLKRPGNGEPWLIEIHVPAFATMITYYDNNYNDWILSPYTLFKMTIDPECEPCKITLQAHTDNILGPDSGMVPTISWLGA